MRSDRCCPTMNVELSRFYHSSFLARMQTERLESHRGNANFPQADFWGVIGTCQLAGYESCSIYTHLSGPWSWGRELSGVVRNVR